MGLIWLRGRSKRLGDLLARDPQYLHDIGDADFVLDSLNIRDRESGDRVALYTQDGEADVHDALDLIAGTALITAPTDLREVNSWRTPIGLGARLFIV